jgi:hypothetical protein
MKLLLLVLLLILLFRTIVFERDCSELNAIQQNARDRIKSLPVGD